MYVIVIYTYILRTFQSIQWQLIVIVMDGWMIDNRSTQRSHNIAQCVARMRLQIRFPVEGCGEGHVI